MSEHPGTSEWRDEAEGPRVRRATISDREAVVRLIRDFNIEDAHVHDDERVTRALAPLLDDDGTGQVWVLELDGELVGYCVLTWGYSLESGGRECIVDEIFVLPSARGWGGRLLDSSIDAARAAGVRVVFLETEAHNERVRSFYLRHGFLVEDSVWMRRALSE